MQIQPPKDIQKTTKRTWKVGKPGVFKTLKTAQDVKETGNIRVKKLDTIEKKHQKAAKVYGEKSQKQDKLALNTKEKITQLENAIGKKVLRLTNPIEYKVKYGKSNIQKDNISKNVVIPKSDTKPQEKVRFLRSQNSQKELTDEQKQNLLQFQKNLENAFKKASFQKNEFMK